MKKEFIRFIVLLVWFVLAVRLLMFILDKTVMQGMMNYITQGVLLYFMVLTALFHFGLLRAAKGNPQAFIRYYMGATGIKLILHIGVVLAFCLFRKAEAITFAVNFAVFYLLFTVFEVTVSMKSLKK